MAEYDIGAPGEGSQAKTKEATGHAGAKGGKVFAEGSLPNGICASVSAEVEVAVAASLGQVYFGLFDVSLVAGLAKLSGITANFTGAYCKREHFKHSEYMRVEKMACLRTAKVYCESQIGRIARMGLAAGTHEASIDTEEVGIRLDTVG